MDIPLSTWTGVNGSEKKKIEFVNGINGLGDLDYGQGSFFLTNRSKAASLVLNQPKGKLKMIKYRVVLTKPDGKVAWLADGYLTRDAAVDYADKCSLRHKDDGIVGVLEYEV